MHIFRFFPDVTIYKNIVYQKRTWGVYIYSGRPAENLVDGNYNSMTDFNIELGTMGFVGIDMGEEREVETIRIQIPNTLERKS